MQQPTPEATPKHHPKTFEQREALPAGFQASLGQIWQEFRSYSRPFRIRAISWVSPASITLKEVYQDGRWVRSYRKVRLDVLYEKYGLVTDATRFVAATQQAQSVDLDDVEPVAEPDGDATMNQLVKTLTDQFVPPSQIVVPQVEEVPTVDAAQEVAALVRSIRSKMEGKPWPSALRSLIDQVSTVFPGVDTDELTPVSRPDLLWTAQEAAVVGVPMYGSLVDLQMRKAVPRIPYEVTDSTPSKPCRDLPSENWAHLNSLERIIHALWPQISTADVTALSGIPITFAACLDGRWDQYTAVLKDKRASVLPRFGTLFQSLIVMSYVNEAFPDKHPNGAEKVPLRSDRERYVTVFRAEEGDLLRCWLHAVGGKDRDIENSVHTFVYRDYRWHQISVEDYHARAKFKGLKADH